MAVIVVFGSLNMDMVVRVPRIAAPGETLLGEGFQLLPGGKGANQAYAAAKLGRGLGVALEVAMAGRVGRDVFGGRLKENLRSVGVNVDAISEDAIAATGIAMISVDAGGQNAIVVAPGANFAFSPQDAQGLRAVLQGASYALFQLENPLDVVAAALAVAKEEGVTTILDPAPARLLPAGMLQHVDILTPNESEACVLLGQPPRALSLVEAAELAERLVALGVPRVLLKLGDKGSLLAGVGLRLHAAPMQVSAVDTTAAGDTFNAALGVALAEEKSFPEAMRFANVAAALSVTRVGAQASVPTREEVDALV